MDLIATTPDDLPPRYGSDRSVTAIARVVRIVEGGRSLVVSLYGGQPLQVSATAVDWAGVETAHVLLDPDTGRPVHALGPAPKPEKQLPAWTAPVKEKTGAREAVLTTEWVGTWDGTAWTRYGGGGAWQGKNPAGQTMRGLATFGRQAEALGPITITAATLTLRPHPTASTWSAQIAPATYTDAGPALAGATVSAPVPLAAGRVDVDIARIADLLTSPGMGLALVGQAYGGIRAGGDSLSIRITYMPREDSR
nr:MAG TPA: hypothetical protein [Caudoviricetes sp.]